VVAVDKTDDSIVAIGRKAKEMIGKTPAYIQAYRPIKSGVIADFEVTARMVHEYLVKTEALSLFNRPVVLVSTPGKCTEVERMAVENAIFESGAKAVGTVKAPIAAAIGAGLKINSTRGCMIVDIGGGMTQAAVICSGGIVRSSAIKLAGDKLDGAIINSLKTRRGLFIGDISAEMIKLKLGVAVSGIDRGDALVSGRNEILKCAETIRVTTAEVYEAIHMGLEAICRTIMNVLETTPPEIASDIWDYGIMLVGGGANIVGIGELITKKTGLRVTIARNPMDCAAIGLGRIIENPRLLPDGVLYKNR
jgi:rod shape-determining protein MreB